MDSDRYIELEHRHGAHNYHPLPVVLTKAEGVWVWDVEGRRYMDCLSSYSAVNQGHRHPRILEALCDQASRLTLTSRAFFNDRLGEFLQKLTALAGMEAALPMNTGAEAVETGIKMARRWGYRKKGIPDDKAQIVVCENNFHGRTTTIVGFSSDAGSREGFGPATPGFVTIPYNDPAALERAINPNTAAFLVEPIQGEAGVIVPDEGYLREVRRICDENHVLLMLDEIQTGLGRTGKMFCYEHDGIKPDILLVGKALGGGVYPVSAALSNWDVMDVFAPGDHGSTFGGNPLACAVGIASIDVLVEEGLAERARVMGARFKEGLEAIAAESDKVLEVRGKGLLIAVQLKEPFVPVRPSCEALMREGVLAKDTHGHSIRIAPPLVIKEEEVDWALERMRRVLIG